MLHHSAHTGWDMCIVAHDWAHDAPGCATERRGVLCSSQYVFFMSQGEGWGAVSSFRFQVSGFRFQRAEGLVSGFKFQVSGAPLLCPPKIGVTSPQGGGGMINGKRKCENGKLIAHPLASYLSPFFTDPSALRAPPLT